MIIDEDGYMKQAERLLERLENELDVNAEFEKIDMASGIINVNITFTNGIEVVEKFRVSSIHELNMELTYISLKNRVISFWKDMIYKDWNTK